MESSEIILLFLKKMRLEKHHSKMISNSLFKINTIDDLQFLLTNVNYLEEIGLSSAEINRFKRLYEKTLKVGEGSIVNVSQSITAFPAPYALI